MGYFSSGLWGMKPYIGQVCLWVDEPNNMQGYDKRRLLATEKKKKIPIESKTYFFISANTKPSQMLISKLF